MFEQFITTQAKDNLVQLIKQCSDFKAKAQTTSKNTLVVGYDHIIQESETAELQEINQDKAKELLLKDLKKTFDEAQRYWGVVLKYMGQWRMAAILDATYSCGMLRWARLTQAVFEQNWPLAAEELLDSRYAHQLGKRAKRNAQILRTNKCMHIDQFERKV